MTGTGTQVLAQFRTEAPVRDAITEKATLLKWLWYHTYRSTKSKPGFPDLCLVRGERLLFIECKRAGKGPTKEQQEWLAALYRIPLVEVYLVHPSNLDEILDALD